MRKAAWLLVLCLLAPVSPRAAVPLQFDDPAQEERFARLTGELRCVVCQNQSLADSDAPLAHDLREELHALLVAGHSDEEIKSFLVERYGDFVLYRPPLQRNTLALWLVPGVLLLGGAVGLGIAIRRRAQLPASAPADGGEPANGEARE